MTRGKTIRILLGLVLVSALAVRSCHVKDPLLVGGTMGTAFNVRITGYVTRSELLDLEREISGTLEEINRQMSTWDPESEISAFNASQKTGPHPVSPGFAEVVRRALAFSEATDGAFDPTLQPLLNLWGFGSGSRDGDFPVQVAIDKVMEITGPDKVWIKDATNLWKAAPGVQLNLGAIAKGYGVDLIGRLLDDFGYDNWFVEIGGEVALRGLNPDDEPWRVGIQYPSGNPAVNRLQGIVHMTNGAVATSGDYRNFIEHEGILYSHIIDPRNGRAVLSDTAGVTVIAPSCMEADAAATALFVMDIEEALRWVEKRPEAEALFLIRSDDGRIFERFSSGFTDTTSYTSFESTPETKEEKE